MMQNLCSETVLHALDQASGPQRPIASFSVKPLEHQVDSQTFGGCSKPKGHNYPVHASRNRASQ